MSYENHFDLSQEAKNLESSLKRAQEANSKPGEREQTNAGMGFMGSFFKIGQAIHQNLIRRDEPALRQLLTHIATQLPSVDFSVGSYIGWVIELMYGWDSLIAYDRFKSACHHRSVIEFFQEFFPYPDSFPEDQYWEPIDMEEMDEMLQRAGNREGGIDPKDVPPGIPASHWWWWFPGTPPENGTAR